MHALPLTTGSVTWGRDFTSCPPLPGNRAGTSTTLQLPHEPDGPQEGCG